MRRAGFLTLPFFLAAMGLTACAPHRLALPTGDGTPAADYASAFASASVRCRDVRTFTAELALSGNVGRRNLRGHLLAGFAPGALRLEATSPVGAPVFILVADDGRGRLLLGRDRRLLDNTPPADIMDALAGLRVAPDDLRGLLGGCVKAAVDPVRGRAFGSDWLALDLNEGGSMYLHRDATAGWRIVAGASRGLDVEYDATGNGLPSRVRMELEAEAGFASKPEAQASLLPDPLLRPEEAMVLEVLRADESLQIDEILELLETQLTSSEVFTALFELEMAGRARQLPGKNYVRVL